MTKNIYTKGGLEKHATEIGGSQSCSFQASATSIRAGGEGGNLPDFVQTQIDKVTDKVDKIGGLPKSERAKADRKAAKETDNTVMVFGIIGGIVALIACIVLIVIVRKKKG